LLVALKQKPISLEFDQATISYHFDLLTEFLNFNCLKGFLIKRQGQSHLIVWFRERSDQKLEQGNLGGGRNIKNQNIEGSEHQKQN
jgi:hypothetical protein